MTRLYSTRARPYRGPLRRGFLSCLALACLLPAPGFARSRHKKPTESLPFTKDERVTIAKALGRFYQISCYFGDAKACSVRSQLAPQWLQDALPALQAHDCFEGRSSEAGAWAGLVDTTLNFLYFTQATFHPPLGFNMPLETLPARYRTVRDNLQQTLSLLRQDGFAGSLEGRGAQMLGHYELVLTSMDQALSALEKRDWGDYEESTLSVAWQAQEIENLLRSEPLDPDAAAVPQCQSLDDALAASSGTLADEARFAAMGNNFFRAGVFDKAMRSYQRFSDIAQARQDGAGVANARAEIAVTDLKLGDQDAMRRDMALALQLADQRGDLFGERRLLDVFGGWLRSAGLADDLQASYVTRAAQIDEQLQGALDGFKEGQRLYAQGRYAQAKDAFLQSAGLGNAASYELIGACDVKLGDNNAALADFQQALSIARAHKEKGVEAQSLIALSLLYAARRDTASAIENGESLLRLEFAVNTSTEVPAALLWQLRTLRASTLDELEGLYNLADHWDDGVRDFQEFYNEARANGDADAAFLVQVHLARAQVAAGSPEAAVATFTDALKSVFGGASLRPESVRFLYQSVFSVRPYWNADIQGFVYRFNRDFLALRDRRLRALRETAAAARRDKDETQEMTALLEIAASTAPAEGYLRRALVLARELKRADVEAACWKSLGELSLARQDYAGAEPDLERALTLAVWNDGRTLSQMDPSYQQLDSAIALKMGDPAVVAPLLARIGDVQLGLGAPLTAIAFIERSLDLEPRESERARTLAEFAARLGAAGYSEQAAAFFEKLLSEPAVDQAPRMKAAVLIALADVEKKSGGLGEDWARQRLELAYNLLEPRGLGGSDVPLLLDLASLRLGQGDVAGAVDADRSALGILEAYRSGLQSENARVAFLGNDLGRSAEYQLAVAGLFAAAARDPAYKDAAFAASERMHARVLLEALSGAQVQASGPLRAQETALAQRIALLVQKGRDAGWDVDDALKFNALQDRLSRLADQIRADDPRYAALRYPQPPTLEGMQKALRPGEAFVSYQQGTGNTLWAFVLRSTGTPRLYALDVSPAAATRRPADPQEKKRALDWQPVFRAAGAALWQPFEADLAGASKVFLVPDGELWELPWSALETDKGALVDQPYTLQIVPSGGVLLELRREKPAPPSAGDLIAFAPFAVPQEQAKAAAALARREHEDHPLPGSWSAMERLRGLFPRQALYLPPQATRERALQESGGYRYVLYDTHGIAEESDPWLSSIAFKDAAGKEELLTVTDVMRLMRLDRCDLVILSACQTARGVLVRGVGVLGLARGLFYAGARGVLATDWSVADAPTSDLVVDFLQGLRIGLDPARALQVAQREIRKGVYYGHSGANPFFWAAFQLYGDP